MLLGGATVLGVIAWAAEAWAFYLVLGWMNVQVPLTFAVFVYAVSMLGGALSFMPGGLGGAEAIMIGLLLWQGTDAADAVAATVIIRVATLWFAVLLGLAAATLRRGRWMNCSRNSGPRRPSVGNTCVCIRTRHPGTGWPGACSGAIGHRAAAQSDANSSSTGFGSASSATFATATWSSSTAGISRAPRPGCSR
jgi:hypothetical protein